MRPFLNSTALLVFMGLMMVVGCLPGGDPTTVESSTPINLSVLALGDSYTVGHSLPQQWSWPVQLADSLASHGDTLQVLDVVAQTGWTTGDLLQALRSSLELGELQTEPYGLVTLMIGVNNQFQGVDLEVFAAEMDTLIGLAVGLAGGSADRVLGFSIPDYGLTPVGQLFNSQQIAAEIQAHNEILSQKFGTAGITLLDITTPSLAVGDDPSLVSRDGLHYSARMYQQWVDLMLPDVCHCLALN